jgi:hypothetical protein
MENYLDSCWNPPFEFGNRWKVFDLRFNKIEWNIALVAVGTYTTWIWKKVGETLIQNSII